MSSGYTNANVIQVEVTPEVIAEVEDALKHIEWFREREDKYWSTLSEDTISDYLILLILIEEGWFDFDCIEIEENYLLIFDTPPLFTSSKTIEVTIKAAERTMEYFDDYALVTANIDVLEEVHKELYIVEEEEEVIEGEIVEENVPENNYFPPTSQFLNSRPVIFTPHYFLPGFIITNKNIVSFSLKIANIECGSPPQISIPINNESEIDYISDTTWRKIYNTATQSSQIIFYGDKNILMMVYNKLKTFENQGE